MICNGSEINLLSCFQTDNCSRPAAVACVGCLEGDVRLVPLPYDLVNYDNQGFQQVELCTRGEWALVCAPLHYLDAAVVCKQLGLPYLGMVNITI